MRKLQKIIKREHLGQPGNLKVGVRRKIVSIRWPPAMVRLVLECGHEVVRREYGAPKEAVRCQECG